MDISEDQLAIEWTLTEQDIQFVSKNSRGQENRICFAADLCTTRAHHRFLDRNETLPLKATNYLSQQLDYTPILAPVNFSLKSDTYLGHQKIMDYLGLREFDEFEKMALQQWLETKIRSQVYLRPETIVEGSTHIIKSHLAYPISNVLGDRLWSSSDGQWYGIQASSLLSSYYPRFFGYYDQAISLYTHIADTFDVFSTHTISCSEREATYVLSGLLSNKSVVNPQFHSTDTHGFTEHIFALCYLLGFSFCPRLKDLTEQRLYKLHKSQNYGEYDCLFSGTVDIELIQEHWDQIIRIVAALKNGHLPAHIIIQKLANRTDKVAKAVQALGRLVKTIYILRYLSDEELRYKVHLQLNRGESRHNLAKALFFDNRGIFKTNDYEDADSTRKVSSRE